MRLVLVVCALVVASFHTAVGSQQAEGDEVLAPRGAHSMRFAALHSATRASSVSEADLEAEAEAQLDAALHARTRAKHRALNHAATRRLAQAAHWFSWHSAQNAHSQLTAAALQTLQSDSDVTDPNPASKLFDEELLMKGVLWNDRPSGSDVHPSDEPLDVETFEREYAYHGQHSSLVHNVHFGCLQHFRSQCPAVQRPDLQSSFGDDRLVLSNRDVRELITNQLRYWWKTAVEQQQQSAAVASASASAHPSSPAPSSGGAAAAAPASLLSAPNRDVNLALGHVLGTIQDSWTKSHVLRSTEDTPSPAGSPLDPDSKGTQMAEKCGKVYYFQGGDSQEGNSAKALESATSSSLFFTCAQYYSFVVLKAFWRCATASAAAERAERCAFDKAVQPTLESAVFALAPEHELSSAGGSVHEFASPRIERLGYSKVEYDVPGVGPVEVWEPLSTSFWRSLGDNDLQVSLCHNVQGKVRNFNGITYRDEPFTDFQNAVRGGRQLQVVTCGVANANQIKTGPFWVLAKSGQCETHGWRLSSSCSTHKSCRPVRGPKACRGRCLCGTAGGCRCVQLLDKATQRCRSTKVEEMK